MAQNLHKICQNKLTFQKIKKNGNLMKFSEDLT